MKNYFSLLLMSALLASCVNFSGVESSPVTYPESRYDSSDVKTTIGHDVADPYGWLEDDLSEETAQWVEAQNAVTFAHLEEIPFRAALRDRLSALWNYAKRGAPFIEGDFRYFYRNDGLQSQYILYRVVLDGDEADAEVFLNPNTFSADGTTSLGGISFSPDGSLVAYQISEGGSDWRKVIILDAVTGNRLGDTLADIKFSGLAWLGNAGFYYSSYDKPEEGSALSGMTDVHRLFYHRLGDVQSEDELIFGGEDLPRRYVQGQVTDDGDWLVVTAAVSTTGNELYVQDLRDADGALVLIAEGFDKEYGVVTSREGKLYIQTNDGAPNNRLMVSQGIALGADAWEEVIAEREFPISFTMGSGYLFVKSLEHALTTVDQYHLTGALIRRVELPGVGTAGGFGGKDDADVLYYNFTNAITPSTIYAYDTERGESSVFHASEIDFDPSGFVSNQIFYTSPDGTVIPMTISHKKGLALDGSNPTMLYGYGGFNISLKPSFSTSYTVWMEQGGILAIPNIRGGGEYGEAWHVAGTKMQKQNVFDDFIAAADYLIDNGYTSHERLALAGGSNGGLLVGAVITQRPELAAVAFPAVGVLDMLRYHTFTAGAGWAYDYGTAEDSDEMFNYLLGYSPVHNVTAGTCYPATMVTTGDHDDRVVPAHSFKFAAELQAKQSCTNPTLIRIETNAGHGAGKPTAMVIEEAIDKFAFAFWHMGITELK
ncbi:MAG: prolyl oligopeptidase family serine peptidase [Flavobacteriales bacterium]